MAVRALLALPFSLQCTAPGRGRGEAERRVLKSRRRHLRVTYFSLCIHIVHVTRDIQFQSRLVADPPITHLSWCFSTQTVGGDRQPGQERGSRPGCGRMRPDGHARGVGGEGRHGTHRASGMRRGFVLGLCSRPAGRAVAKAAARTSCRACISCPAHRHGLCHGRHCRRHPRPLPCPPPLPPVVAALPTPLPCPSRCRGGQDGTGTPPSGSAGASRRGGGSPWAALPRLPRRGSRQGLGWRP